MVLETVAGAEKWIINNHGGTPIGLLLTLDRSEQDAIEPHVQWFPWTRPREIPQAFEDVISFFTKTKNVIVVCRTQFTDFYDALVKRGKIRKVGFLEKMPMGIVHIYQAVKQ